MIQKCKFIFPNSEGFEEEILNTTKFQAVNEFSDQVFGWYMGIYISILK